ncbi:hypothetical protein D8M04_13565 [Oceanobacillus piezotolerans]|uniref:Uncharacterized protein n=1 Tax=Oceanobacillus piezotolerans TaxID=2448030 RepID=A0A498D9R0_9BACI|nr:hypothetical protein [Oceanobacillus piezotolerans]RLL43927.1 hypothetical protein D8M04_13565 [Oceanobacillus piezotolerans]
MKRSAEELLEEISDFLVIYLKSGQVGINSFLKKTDLPISQMDQLLKVHFLLKDEVKQFVRELPKLIKRFKTSTTLKQETYHGLVKGQINWNRTINDRFRINAKDKTIFSANERNREYAIKENLVLLEVVQTLYTILFREVDSNYLEKYAWFKEWGVLKSIVSNTLYKNIYLSRVRMVKGRVTDRMILDTLKHRNPLYRSAASILQQYRKLLYGEIDEQEVQTLLRETFVYPKEVDVLFELYWVVKLIEENTENADLQLMDGRNNLVAQWSDDYCLYKVYHDSTGSNQIKFHISTDELKEHEHPFISRRLSSIEEADTTAKKLFNQSFDTKTYWSGRPDILVEMYDKKTNELLKVVIGEVKHTNRIEYAITGLRELVDYMKLVQDKNGLFLEDKMELQGILFTGRVDEEENRVNNLSIGEGRDGISWCVD